MWEYMVLGHCLEDSEGSSSFCDKESARTGVVMLN